MNDELLRTLRVRAAVAADSGSIIAFNEALAWDTEHKRLDRAVLTAGVAQALCRPELCRYYVAEIGAAGDAGAARVIGQTMVTYEMSDWRNGVVHWIQSVYVHPEWRGRGVYRRLYAHVRDAAAREGNVPALRLYVEKANHGAIASYQRLGMMEAPFHIYESELLPVGVPPSRGLTDFS